MWCRHWAYFFVRPIDKDGTSAGPVQPRPWPPNNPRSAGNLRLPALDASKVGNVALSAGTLWRGPLGRDSPHRERSQLMRHFQIGKSVNAKIGVNLWEILGRKINSLPGRRSQLMWSPTALLSTRTGRWRWWVAQVLPTLRVFFYACLFACRQALNPSSGRGRLIWYPWPSSQPQSASIW